MADIFISYSSQDREQALRLVDELRASGFDVWIDRSGIGAATSWSKEIAAALEGCKAMILLLSSASIASRNVVKEVTLAAEWEKQIIPVDIEPVRLTTDVAYHLAGLQRTPFSDHKAIGEALVKLGLGTATPKNANDARLRLAVLPFEDLSPAKDHGWFSDGLAYELIDTLGKISKLFVTDKQTVREFKQTTLPSKELSQALEVRYLVFGSVLKAGEKLRIHADLVDGETGETLWNFKQMGTSDDIFDMQEQVAKEISQGLKVKLTPLEESSLGERLTDNAEAYDRYLEAISAYEQQTRKSFDRALVLYGECTKLDPRFAMAHIGITNTLIAIYRSYDRSAEVLARAEASLANAKALRGDLPVAYSMTGLLAHLRGDNEVAFTNARKAIELAPENTKVRFHLAFLCMQTGKHDEAAREFERIVAQEPANLAAHVNLCICYDNYEAQDEARQAAERAIPIVEKYLELHPDDQAKRQWYALFLLFAGRKEYGEQVDRILASGQLDGATYFNCAWICARMGNTAKAMDLLEAAVDNGYHHAEQIQGNVPFTPLFETPAGKNSYCGSVLLRRLRKFPARYYIWLYCHLKTNRLPVTMIGSPMA